MEKQYHALIEDRIYFGGANDVQQMADEENIDVVVDLREESTGCAASQPHLTWTQIPLGDHALVPESDLFKNAIDAVVSAYREGKKVAFHCGGGRGRTGTVAAGVLLELGLCSTLEEAEAKAKSIRPVLSIKAEQRVALEQIYPHATLPKESS
ncbi:MAG: protein tyrosine phosphatase [Gammaproteobacteria bacterium]|nr:protein tyrosine phosphatase [Gammaproteobacteria bacterium]NBT43326.1 protein tyrosine phosphatase [Gammaproteobacteria bacterium]NBY21388.1 protein tyrosine phosphatase [Gammaproteobacteria bacterium]